MIHILLTVLKIIGIILLLLFLTVLALLLIVLLVPVRYNVRAGVNDCGTESSMPVKTDIRFSLDCTWLLRFAGLRVSYRNQELSYQVRLAFFTIIDSGKKKKKEKKKTEWQAPAAAETMIHEEPVHNAAGQAEKLTESEQKQAVETSVKSTPEKKQKKKKRPETAGGSGRLREKAERAAAMVHDQENQELIIFLLENIKKIFRHIRPQKHRIVLYFGAEDPSVTGQAYGAFCVINSILSLNFSFEPEFQKEILRLTAEISGRIQILCFLVTVLRVYFNKTFRRLIGGSK